MQRCGNGGMRAGGGYVDVCDEGCGCARPKVGMCVTGDASVQRMRDRGGPENVDIFTGLLPSAWPKIRFGALRSWRGGSTLGSAVCWTFSRTCRLFLSSFCSIWCAFLLIFVVGDWSAALIETLPRLGAPRFRRRCYKGDQQLKLVARRTGAGRLFILPQGHAVHDAGSHDAGSVLGIERPLRYFGRRSRELFGHSSKWRLRI
jgi:hypothetical protein